MRFNKIVNQFSINENDFHFRSINFPADIIINFIIIVSCYFSFTFFYFWLDFVGKFMEMNVSHEQLFQVHV